MAELDKPLKTYPDRIRHFPPDLSEKNVVSEASRLTEKLIDILAGNKYYTKALIEKQLSRDSNNSNIEFTSGKYNWTVQLCGSDNHQNWELSRLDRSTGEYKILQTRNVYTETEPHPKFPSLYIHPKGIKGIISASRILVNTRKKGSLRELFDNCTEAVNIADDLLDSMR